MNDIAEVIMQISSKKANLIVPVTAYSEVLTAKHTEEQVEKFRKFLQRSNIVKADMTFTIAEKMEQIRSKGLRENPKRKIGVPNATYIATTIIYRADVLHSLDTHMTNLNGNPIVEGLTITQPRDHFGQNSLLGKQS